MIKFGSNEKGSNEDIVHWKCSSCGKEVTYVENDKIGHITHFDIERSRKDLYLEAENIVEFIENRNLKMDRVLCEDCFLKILNESPTLGKLFHIKEFDKFIY